MRKYSDGRIIIDFAGVIRTDFIVIIRIDSFDKNGNYLCLFYDLKEGTRKILCEFTPECMEAVDVQKEL